jgi:hypothetical protein
MDEKPTQRPEAAWRRRLKRVHRVLMFPVFPAPLFLVVLASNLAIHYQSTGIKQQSRDLVTMMEKQTAVIAAQQELIDHLNQRGCADGRVRTIHHTVSQAALPRM